MKKKLIASLIGLLSLISFVQIESASAQTDCYMPANSSCWVLAASGSIEMTMSGNHMVGIKHGPNNSYVAYAWEAWLPSWCMGAVHIKAGNNAGIPATLYLAAPYGQNCLPVPNVYSANLSAAWKNTPKISISCGAASSAGTRNFFGTYGTYVTGNWFEAPCGSWGASTEYYFW